MRRLPTALLLDFFDATVTRQLLCGVHSEELAFVHQSLMRLSSCPSMIPCDNRIETMWYRFFLLDNLGHVTGCTPCDRPNDLEALEAAQIVARQKGPLEVWLGARLVASVDRTGFAVDEDATIRAKYFGKTSGAGLVES